MTANALAAVPKAAAIDPGIVESVLLRGDLRQLSPALKVNYYNAVCASLGLNPLTQPFAYIMLNGKEVLYAKREATEQLRKVHGVSITITARELIDGVYVVTACAIDRGGRRDESTGAVAVENLKGEAKANAMLKAETKAKRRVTLSICGLGMLDETEVESIPHAVHAQTRIELPAGTVQILKAATRQARGVQWAEVTYVTADGEEQTLPTPADGKGAALALFEELAQSAVPVVIETAVTPRSKKTVIANVKRWKSPEQSENASLDAEIVKADESEIPF